MLVGEGELSQVQVLEHYFKLSLTPQLRFFHSHLLQLPLQCQPRPLDFGPIRPFKGHNYCGCWPSCLLPPHSLHGLQHLRALPPCYYIRFHFRLPVALVASQGYGF